MFKCNNCNKQINPKIIENYYMNNYNTPKSCITNNSQSFKTKFSDSKGKDKNITLAYGSISPCTGKIASPDFSGIGVL